MHNTVDDDAVDFSHYWRVVKKRRTVLGCLVTVVTGVAVVVSLLLPKVYTARAVILPIGTSGGGGLAALASQMGGLGSLVGLGGGSGPSQQFMALLNTRTLAEHIIDDNDLLPALFPKELNRPSRTNEDSVNLLQGSMKFVEDKKSGVITISAKFKDPQLAARVANAYVTGLQGFVNGNSFTVSKRNRIFIEKQLEENKRDLLGSGKELSEFYRGNRVSGVESHVDVSIAGNKKFKSRQSRYGVGLGGVDKDDNNVEEKQKSKLEQLKNRNVELQSMLQHFSVDQPSDKVGSDAFDAVPKLDNEEYVKNVPQQVYLQYLTLHRNMLAQINTLLTQQYEMAKINEMKDELAFQVIDPARVPGKRSGPRRTQIVLIVFGFSLFFGVLSVITLDRIKQPNGEQYGA